MNLQWVESLFVLSDEQKQRLNVLEQYEVYFCMLRHEYLESATGIGAIVDLFYCLYEEKELYLNSEITMYYLLRHFVIDTTMRMGFLKKLRLYTVGNIALSLISAALITNIMLDAYRKVLPNFEMQDIYFFRKYVKSMKKLFDESFQHIEAYPKKYVLIETKFLQEIRKYINDHYEQTCGQLQEVYVFVSNYTHYEQQIFGEGELPTY